jgi:hypothetical protein
MAETRAERAVVDCTLDLQEEIGASPRPSHLLRLVHPPIDQEVGGTCRGMRVPPSGAGSGAEPMRPGSRGERSVLHP